MNIAITFRHMEAMDSLKAYTTEKVGRLQKFLRQPMKAQVTLSTQHRQHTAEVDIHSGSEHFHAHETSEDMYATIDRVVDKLDRQMRSIKEEKSKKGADRASDHLASDESTEE